MNSERKSKLEAEIWNEIKDVLLSPSHDHRHIERVLKFARQLHTIHGGDWEVISAAAMMHDLGRSDPSKHGEESIDDSVQRASDILLRTSFPKAKAEHVLLAIMEHDKPEFRPSTIEGRILKDSDFLAGFGAWGILRIALWAGETGGGVDQILDRLEYRMPKRLQNLEFEESRHWAEKEALFAALFVSLLNKEPVLPTDLPRGKYVILEGNSGTGKDTQAEILKDRLVREGLKVLLVSEPTIDYKAIRELWRRKYPESLVDPMIRRFLFLADRYKLIQEKVKPALHDGYIVISVRSYISSLVYQCETDDDTAALACLHQFVPTPSVIILYDLDARIADQRILARDRKRGRYENLDDLEKYRKRYMDVCRSNLVTAPVRIIPALESIEEVSTRTWNDVNGAFCIGKDTHNAEFKELGIRAFEGKS